MNETNHLLFSYGTLQLEKVQLDIYGRLLKGKPDTLTGYKIEKLQITDASVLAKSEVEYHPIAVKSNDESDFIDGVVFEITDSELLETDIYEGDQYHRILETFNSGKKAWVYVARTN